jgi:Thiamine pyrophosphokinase
MQNFLHILKQDTNDADKSVRHCLELGFKVIHLLSADGGRQDQFLSGLEILFKYSEQARLVSWTQMERMEFIHRDWEEKIAPGTTLSMLPVFGGARGIVTKGLKYALNDQNLMPGKSPSGVSNLVVSNPVSIKIKKGRLLLVVQHKELLN